MKKRLQWYSTWGSVIAWCLVLFFLSAQPDLRMPGEIPESDKAAHLLVYGILGWLWGRAVRVSRPGASTLAVLLSAVVFTGMYGLSDEGHQLYVVGRSADWLDVLTDACGGTLGGVVFLWRGRFGENDREQVTVGDPRQLRDPYDPAA
jgi:VanZ family protein